MIRFTGFLELQKRVVERARYLVRNGQCSERGLAKLLGVSQPHMHNVLSGTRSPSPELCDLLLLRLQLSIGDLMDASDNNLWYLGILDGRIGPGDPWPERLSGERVAIPRTRMACFEHHVAARLGEDPRIDAAFQTGDLVILDQALSVRGLPQPGVQYLIKHGSSGLIRQVHRSENGVYLVAADVLENSAAWEHVELPSALLPQLIRARVHRAAIAAEWCY